jgi:hypothetical protein
MAGLRQQRASSEADMTGTELVVVWFVVMLIVVGVAAWFVGRINRSGDTDQGDCY